MITAGPATTVSAADDPTFIDLSLKRMWRLLAALGNPQDRLPPVLHVAGTNGKGSTLAMVRAMVEAAGKRAHVYTSPHLVAVNERVCVSGTVADDSAFRAALKEVERHNAGEQITFFEKLTCAAFLMFANAPADVTLLETGLGGRLDATNVVAAPTVVALTPIALDHQRFLGNDLGTIAGEKAAIIKPGARALSAPQAPEAWAAIKRYADRIEVTVTAVDPKARHIPPLALPGPHQRVNAALAMACVDALPLTVSDEQQRRGLARARWPGRLQRVDRGPLRLRLPTDFELWLDGAHNAHAAAALAAWLACSPPMPTDIVFGLANSRRPAEFISPLALHAARVRSVAIPGSTACHDPDTLAAAAGAAGIIDSMSAPSIATALDDLAHEGGPRRVLVCGSLYLVGSLLAQTASMR